MNTDISHICRVTVNFHIKIGGTELIKDGEDNLKALSDKIDTIKMKIISLLMVLTGIGDYAYKRISIEPMVMAILSPEK